MPDSDELQEWMILGKVAVKTLTVTVGFGIICVLNVYSLLYLYPFYSFAEKAED